MCAPGLGPGLRFTAAIVSSTTAAALSYFLRVGRISARSR